MRSFVLLMAIYVPITASGELTPQSSRDMSSGQDHSRDRASASSIAQVVVENDGGQSAYARWEFDGNAGKGTWNDGSQAELTVVKWDASEIEIKREDVTDDLTGTYVGKQEDHWIEGDFTYTTSGGGIKHSHWHAMSVYVSPDPQPPPNHAAFWAPGTNSLWPPRIVHICERSLIFNKCGVWTWNDSLWAYESRYSNGENGLVTIDVFERDRVQFQRVNWAGPFAGMVTLYQGEIQSSGILLSKDEGSVCVQHVTTIPLSWDAAYSGAAEVTPLNTRPYKFNFDGYWVLDNKQLEIHSDGDRIAAIRGKIRDDGMFIPWGEISFQGTIDLSARKGKVQVADYALVGPAMSWITQDLTLIDPDRLQVGDKIYDRITRSGFRDIPCDDGNSYHVRADGALSRASRDEGFHDYKSMVCWLQIAAGTSPIAARYLGYLYSEWNDVPRDDALAFKWMKKAAEADDYDAALKLSSFYTSGVGTQPDVEKARIWKEKGEQLHKDEVARAAAEEKEQRAWQALGALLGATLRGAVESETRCILPKTLADQAICDEQRREKEREDEERRARRRAQQN
jgi:hypothetical protein